MVPHLKTCVVNVSHQHPLRRDLRAELMGVGRRALASLGLKRRGCYLALDHAALALQVQVLARGDHPVWGEQRHLWDRDVLGHPASGLASRTQVWVPCVPQPNGQTAPRPGLEHLVVPAPPPNVLQHLVPQVSGPQVWEPTALAPHVP